MSLDRSLSQTGRLSLQKGSEEAERGVFELLIVGLRVEASGAYRGGLYAFVYITALAALPEDSLVGFEEVAGLDTLEELAIATSVLSLSDHDALPSEGDFFKTFFASDAGKLGIEFVSFFELACLGSLEVLFGGADLACGIHSGDFEGAAFEELKETLSVYALLFCCLTEEVCDFLVAVLVCLTGKEEVTVGGLAFAGKGLQEVLLGLCTFDAHR